MTDLLLETLRKTFQLDAFRPGQKEIIAALRRGENTLAVMPTGGGKSLCYQLPAVLAEGVTIVVSPLIALMADQVAALARQNIPAAAVHSMASPAERRAAADALAAGTLKLLYVAPERFSSARFRERIAPAPISHFIIDEAHCVSQWGHDFRPEYTALRPAIVAAGSPPVGAFTATATPEVRRDIEVQLGIEGATYFFTGFDRENLRLEVVPTPRKVDKLAAIMRLLAETPGPAIIYSATRKATEEVALELAGAHSVVRYHAGLADEERAAAQEAFLSGRARVIVATCAFGMGIDKADIRLIVHHAITDSVEAYYQEIGRAGRDGEEARCVLLWQYGDVMVRRHLLEKDAAVDPEHQSAKERRLRKMLGYVDSYQCRRGFIVDYFLGRHAIFKCGICDNCAGRNLVAAARAKRAKVAAAEPRQALLRAVAEPAAATGAPEALDWARMALACVERIRRAGTPPAAKLVASVLRGRRTEEISAQQFDKLSTWNLLPGWSRKEMAELLRVIKDAGLVNRKARLLELTALGREVMAGKKKIELPFARAAATGTVIVEKSEAEPEPVFDEKLFTELKTWRRGTASEKSVPAYCIMHDRTLQAIAAARPSTREALLAVRGMGEVTVERYGEAILTIVRKPTS